MREVGELTTHSAIPLHPPHPHLGRPARALWRALRRLAASVTPASGAVVMATGIVSIAFALDGRQTLSRVLLVMTAGEWVLLGALLGARAMWDRPRARREARVPASLEGVAGTAVLGTRLTLLGWRWAAIALLGVALTLWLLLLPAVLAHWVTPTWGGSLLLVVSTESLAVAGATLATLERVTWLLYAAGALFVLGLAFYAFVIARLEAHELLRGVGDHWVTGGALAISALAIGHLTLGAQQLGLLGAGAGGALEDLSLAMWAAAIAWLPVLLAAEAVRPRLRYDVRRWSTVFPLGMYAACSFVVAQVSGSPAIGDFARAWVWVAFAVWALALAGTARRGAAVARVPGQRTEI